MRSTSKKLSALLTSILYLLVVLIFDQQLTLSTASPLLVLENDDDSSSGLGQSPLVLVDVARIDASASSSPPPPKRRRRSTTPTPDPVLWGGILDGSEGSVFHSALGLVPKFIRRQAVDLLNSLSLNSPGVKIKGVVQGDKLVVEKVTEYVYTVKSTTVGKRPNNPNKEETDEREDEEEEPEENEGAED